MTIEVVDSINVPEGNDSSADRFGWDTGSETAWLLDGASATSKTRLIKGTTSNAMRSSDAAWYAKTLSNAFGRIRGAPFPFDKPAKFFRDNISFVRQRFNELTSKQPEDFELTDLPSAAGIFMAHQRDAHKLWFYGLEDCTGITLSRGKSFVTTPSTPKEQERERIYTDPEQTLAAYKARKATMNQPGGYSVFSLHPDAVSGIKTESIALPTDRETHVLLMSDGLGRLCDVFRMFTHAQLINRAITSGLANLAQELRNMENAYETGAEFGCAKKHDDTGALLLRITP